MSGPEAVRGGSSSARESSPLGRLEPWAHSAALLGAGVSVVVAVTASARAGCFVLAGVLLLAAVVRAAGPDDRSAGVAVRSTTFDVSFLSGLAVVIAVLAATASGV